MKNEVVGGITKVDEVVVGITLYRYPRKKNYAQAIFYTKLITMLKKVSK